MEPYDFLSEFPRRKEYKNKRTGRSVKACRWAKDVVEIEYIGIKYSKTGSRDLGKKTKTMKKEEFNRNYYLHDNGI